MLEEPGTSYRLYPELGRHPAHEVPMRSPFWSDQRRPWRVLLATILGTTLGCNDATDSPLGPEPASTLAAATALAFRQVDEGIEFYCGVTTDDRAYCWG